MKRAVALIATSAVIAFSTENFLKNFSVFSHPFSGSHAVLVLGHGKDPIVDFWIKKNNWGQTWREEWFREIDQRYHVELWNNLSGFLPCDDGSKLITILFQTNGTA